MPGKYLMKFSDCFFVKGENRSTICDVTRGQIELIPNDLFDFVETNNLKSIDQILSEYNIENKDIILEYLKFLEDKEYIFRVDKSELQLFPEIEIKNITSSIISYVIIEVSLLNFEIVCNLLHQIETLGAKYLQFRTFDNIEPAYLASILSQIDQSRIEQIEIYMPYYEKLNCDEMRLLIDENQRISTLYIFKSPECEQKQRWRTNIIRNKKNILSHADFSDTIVSDFRCNLDFFMEAHFFNVYYNRKLAMDKAGNLKNCLALEESFGNIKNTNILTLVDSEDFRRLWFIKKDDILQCKTCEFRYVCFDSLPPQKKGNKFYRPFHCEHKA